MKILFFLIIAFLWSWTNWFAGLHYLPDDINAETIKIFVKFFFIGVYGPAIGAIAVTLYCNGRTGIIVLFKKLLTWKVPVKNYLIIIFLPLLCLLSGVGLYSLFIGNTGHFDSHAMVLIPSIIWAALPAGPLGEELGWRGFLLPELQKKFSAIQSSLIIGVIWYVWHLPLFFAPFGTLVSDGSLTFFPLVSYLVFVVCSSCIYTWLINQSKGSILIAILIHLSINAGFALLFFPALQEHNRLVYFLSIPAFLLVTVYLVVTTRLEQNSSANKSIIESGAVH